MPDVRVKQRADSASYHHLVTAKLQLELKKYTQANTGRTRYNIELLSDGKTTQAFQPALFNQYQLLQDMIDENVV